MIELCHRLGLAVAHFGKGMTKQGAWLTMTVADGTGFPDLVICGHGRLLFAELKSDKGRPAERQLMWIDRLRKAGQECYVWKPSDWSSGAIEAALKGAA